MLATTRHKPKQNKVLKKGTNPSRFFLYKKKESNKLSKANKKSSNKIKDVAIK